MTPWSSRARGSAPAAARETPRLASASSETIRARSYASSFPCAPASPCDARAFRKATAVTDMRGTAGIPGAARWNAANQRMYW